MNYQDVVEILNASLDRPVRPERFETFKRAVAFYGAEFPDSGKGVILVAGTNGKGTTSKTLETLLASQANVTVGLYTSPHLIEPTERIRSHGCDLTQLEMVQTYELVAETARRFSLSHFEILTLMMIEIFYGGRVRPTVSHSVIEVGVGGRLDPTRVVPHETAVLTRVGLDHEAILGRDLKSIAQEKLAIAEGARKLIYTKQDLECEDALAHARLLFPACEFIPSREFSSTVEMHDSCASSERSNPQWTIETPWGQSPLSLLGERAVQNTSLALEVLTASGFDVRSMLPSLAKVEWPGRMESIRFRGREIFLSGDHNPLGVQSLTDLLMHFRYRNVWLVVGIGKGKPIADMLALYQKIGRGKLILTRTSFRSIEMSELEHFRNQVCAIIEKPLQALEFTCAQASPHDVVVVSGSLYLVGDLRKSILQSETGL